MRSHAGQEFSLDEYLSLLSQEDDIERTIAEEMRETYRGRSQNAMVYFNNFSLRIASAVNLEVKGIAHIDDYLEHGGRLCENGSSFKRGRTQSQYRDDILSAINRAGMTHEEMYTIIERSEQQEREVVHEEFKGVVQKIRNALYIKLFPVFIELRKMGYEKLDLTP